MDRFEFIGSLSLVIDAIIYMIYIPSMLRGKTRPHIFSWAIWGTLTYVLFWVQWTSGSGAGSWATLSTAFACTLVVLLCFKYGTKDITRSDVAALILGFIAIAAWVVQKDPFWTVVLILLAEGLGFYSTARKSYHKPYEEPLIIYVLSIGKLFSSMGATEAYNFNTLAYPICYSAMYVAFVSMVAWRRRTLV